MARLTAPKIITVKEKPFKTGDRRKAMARAVKKPIRIQPPGPDGPDAGDAPADPGGLIPPRSFSGSRKAREFPPVGRPLPPPAAMAMYWMPSTAYVMGVAKAALGRWYCQT